MSNLFDQMWPAFLAEVSEQLDELEESLAASDSTTLDIGSTFRLFHTIKSSSAMMDFVNMELLAHAAEDILDLVRGEKATMTNEIGDLLVAVAGRLKVQLAQANNTKLPPDGDAQLLAQARAMLVSLGGTPPQEAVARPVEAEQPEHEEAPVAVDKIFSEFAESLETLWPAIAKWVAGKATRRPKELDRLVAACDAAGFPALRKIVQEMSADDVKSPAILAADFCLRLDPLRKRSGLDCGANAFAKIAQPLWVPEINALAIECLSVEGLENASLVREDVTRLIESGQRLGAMVRLCGFSSLALLLRFVGQILLEVERGNLALPAQLAELLMSAYSLCLEIEEGQAEDDAFAEICGRVLTTLQEMARNANSHEQAPDDRATLTDEFDIPYSLVVTLHEGCLSKMVEFCRRKIPLLDIEVDMDGPEALRDNFIQVISDQAEVLSNRTVFASDRPGDLSAETTRLSIIAACTGDATALIAKLQEYHSEHFHLSVQPVEYRGVASIESKRFENIHAERSAASDNAPQQEQSSATDTLRVSSGRLDQFVTRIGELALLRNQMDYHLRGNETENLLLRFQAFSRRLSSRKALAVDEQQELSDCVDEMILQMERLGQTDSQMQQSLGLLQSDALDLRVVPVDTIFRRVPVLVRRLARQLGKDVNLVMEGKDTRIDKSMVDVLSEPLMHMVRNALDHGLETPQQRIDAGKETKGSLVLRARQQGGSLLIELIDDGRGLNDEQIRRKAIERGVLQEAQALTISTEQLHALIFDAGFSTAGSITETSGRGVGMDIVRTRVEQLGGKITLQSNAGRGCHIALHLPLSAAIQGIILFSSESEVYGIAERSISEAIEVPLTSVQSIQGQMAIMHRDHALPVYTLPHLFSQPESDWLAGMQSIPVLLVSDGRRQIGILVSQVNARQEIFVRDCHPDIASLPGVSGASVLGNGDPVLILEASGLIDLAAQQAQGLAALMEVS
ncbi:MAG: ATP-binding protein [Alcanivoracaceae bacterium]|nr:ATP-binding protein [Alcanivoracaceae bacterium]